MPDTIPFCAQRKPETGRHDEEEKGQRRQVLTFPARVVTDSRRLLPPDPEAFPYPVGAISAKTI